MTKQIFKSIGAVIAGALVGAILSIITDTVLEKLGIFTPINQPFVITWMVTLAIVYRCIYSVLGGYLTAVLAPSNPKRHVIILASIALLVNLLGLLTTWGKGLGAWWYPVALTVLAFPSVWVGGKLKKSYDQQ
jgi:Na+/phosphate symporter